MFLTDGRPILAPAVCFICEQTPPVRYVDTLIEWEAQGITNLDGRKYVCENCVDQFADLMGYERPSTVDRLILDLEEANAEIDELRSGADLEQALRDAVSVLKPARAKATNAGQK